MFATNCGPFQGKFNRWLALSSLLLILGLCCLEVRADTKPLVLTGQVAPGTEGARFASFVSPIVNTSGDVVFTADLAGGASSSGVFKISNGAVAPVVLQGQLKPDSGKVFGGMGNAFINGVGDVVFTSSSGPDEAIFIASGEAIRKLVDDANTRTGRTGTKFYPFL